MGAGLAFDFASACGRNDAIDNKASGARALGIAQRLAGAFPDCRNLSRITHTLAE
jgi:hypothetical protein